MDKQLYEERKELEIKLNELNHLIRVTNEFLREKTKYYTYPESIEALKNIKEILERKNEECKVLRERRHIVKRDLAKSCNHEIIFGDELNTFCALCHTLIINTPETTVIELILPGQWEDPIIKSDNEFNDKCLRRIIYETGEEFIYHEDIQASEDTFEELQYCSNIQVRRLK